MNGVGRLRTRQVRVAAAIALLVITALSVRGIVPDATHGPRRPPQDSMWSALTVVALMALSTGIAVIALIVLIRHPGVRKQPLAPLPEPDRRRDGRSRRALAVGVATIVFFATVVALLTVNVGLNRRPETATPPAQSQQATSDAGSGRDREEPPSDTRPTGPNLFPVLAAASAVMVATLVIGSAVVSHRNRTQQKQFDDVRLAGRPGSATTTLARAAGMGLAEVADPGREPRAAIIACYAAMERGLADSPDSAPLASDTPSEVLARAVSHGALHSTAAQGLVAIFTEARFSPHNMTEVDRDSAVDLLERVLADLRGAAWAG